MSGLRQKRLSFSVPPWPVESEDPLNLRSRSLLRSIVPLLLGCAFVTVAKGAQPIHVLVWDERQPRQSQAYDNFLGNEIATRLARSSDRLQVRSVCWVASIGELARSFDRPAGAHQKTRSPRPRFISTCGRVSRAITKMIASGVAVPEASARRLSTTGYHPVGKYSNNPLGHLLCIFCLTIPGPGANQKEPVIVRKGSIATRDRDPTISLSLQGERSAREISRGVLDNTAARPCRLMKTAPQTIGFASG